MYPLVNRTFRERQIIRRKDGDRERERLILNKIKQNREKLRQEKTKTNIQ